MKKYTALFLALAMGLCSPAQADSAKKKVGVTIVKPTTFEERIKFPAGVFAKDDVVLGAEVPGRVTKIGVEEGDIVMKGDRIISIDSRTYEAALRAAEADAELAAKELERGKTLIKNAVISNNDFDALSARSKASQAALDVARINLEKAYMLAPFSGVVDRIMVEDGAFAGVGDPVIRLVNPEVFEVHCSIPEKDIPFIRKGAEVVLTHRALGVEKTGTIVFSAIAADMQSMTYPVKIRGANTEPRFFSGMIVDADFVRRSLENVIAVPLFCVMQDSGGTFVYLEHNGKSVRRNIVIGGVTREMALVAEGLEAGARLISVGQRSIEEGDEIIVAEEKSEK